MKELKLPEVGKRYKNNRNAECVAKVFGVEEGRVIYWTTTSKPTAIALPIEAFWNVFEEVKETNDRVEKAKKQLEYHIGITTYFDKELALQDFKIAAQKLLDALEEKEPNDMDLVKNALKEGIKTMKDFNKDLDDKYPYCKSEPKSIWKDVSELPEEFDEIAILWKDENNNVAIGGYFRDKDHCGGLVMGNLERKKYCTLTDFINQHNSLEERVKKLEGK